MAAIVCSVCRSGIMYLKFENPPKWSFIEDGDVIKEDQPRNTLATVDYSLLSCEVGYLQVSAL